MPDPTLPLPTEPVPYFDPTAMNPVVPPDDGAETVRVPGYPDAEPALYEPPAPVASPVSSQPVVSAPPVASTPPLYQPPIQPYVEQQPYPGPQQAYPQPPAYPQSPAPQPPTYSQPHAYQAPPPPAQPALTSRPAPPPQPQQRPAPLPSPAPPPPIVAQIGDVRVSSTTIYTPIGEFPLRGSQWAVTDQWQATQKTPTWAIVLAIVLFFCLTIFSLLFLLAKEVVYTGMVQVVITNGTKQYVTRIPVTSQAQVSGVHQQVNYVRSLAAL